MVGAASSFDISQKLVRRTQLLNEIHSWLVCACIATPEDMAQSFLPFMQAIEEELGLDEDKQKETQDES